MPAKKMTAMDYLMTYGWIILIFIVVISALYSFGIFGRPKEEDEQLTQERRRKEAFLNFCKSLCKSRNATLHGSYGDVCRCKERVCERFIIFFNKTFGVNCETQYNEYLLIEGEIYRGVSSD